MIKRGEVVIVVALFVLLSASIAGGLQQRVQATPAPTQRPSIGVSAQRVSMPTMTCSNTPSAGHKYIAVYCTVQNFNASGLTVDPSDWQLHCSGYIQQVPTSCYWGAFPHVSNTDIGDIVRGDIVYEVDQNAQPSSITYHGPSNISPSSVTISL